MPWILSGKSRKRNGCNSDPEYIRNGRPSAEKTPGAYRNRRMYLCFCQYYGTGCDPPARKNLKSSVRRKKTGRRNRKNARSGERYGNR